MGLGDSACAECWKERQTREGLRGKQHRACSVKPGLNATSLPAAHPRPAKS